MVENEMGKFMAQAATLLFGAQIGRRSAWQPVDSPRFRGVKRRRRRTGNRVAGTAGVRSGSVLEAPALVVGVDDLAVVGQAVEQRRGHLGVAQDGWPFAEGEVGGDDEVASDELVCSAALASGAEFGPEVVDQVDDVMEAAPGALADAGAGEMGLAGGSHNGADIDRFLPDT